jgi:hypothetical protein
MGPANTSTIFTNSLGRRVAAADRGGRRLQRHSPVQLPKFVTQVGVRGPRVNHLPPQPRVEEVCHLRLFRKSYLSHGLRRAISGKELGISQKLTPTAILPIISTIPKLWI